MQFLIYYLATGSNTLFNFINSKGEIQAVEELEQIPVNFLKKLKKNDYFLDFVTGENLFYRIILKVKIIYQILKKPLLLIAMNY